MSGIELEEGEALPRFSDFDENIDPDKDFAYIDKKIQDVLGQYQRDFMGEVSTESLGARYGGYGSFLPAYQRSPSTLAHPRDQSHLSSRSANNIPLEGPTLDSLQTNGYVPRRNSSSNYYEAKSLSAPGTDDVLQTPLVLGTEDATLVSVQDTFSADSCKHQISGEYVANKESRCLPRNGAVQNPLKFRVKVVADSLLPRDNSAIYSGLGLDMSPSTSLENSPSDVDEASPNMQEMPERSPSCLIEIMTSFHVPAGKIISPLRGSLLHLVEYQSKLENGRPDPHQVESLTVVHGSALPRRITEASGEMKVRLTENNVEVGQIQKENYEGQIDASCPSLISGVKKQGVSKLSDLAVPMDKLSASGNSCVSNGKDEVGYLEEVSGKSLQHQLVLKDKAKELRSDSASFLEVDLKDKERKIGVGPVVKMGNASPVSRNDAILNEVNEDSPTDSIKSISERGLVKQDKREMLDSVPLPDSDVTDEKQPNRTEKISKNKKANFSLRKDAGDNNSEVQKVNRDVIWGIKDHNRELVETSIEKLDLKGVPSFKKGALPKGRQYSSSGGRKKSKEIKNDGRLATELTDLSSRFSSSPAQADAPVLRIKFPSKGGKVDLKPHTESRNLKYTSDEMHGDLDFMKKEKIKDSKNSMRRLSMGEIRLSNAKVKEKSGNKISESFFNTGPNLKGDQSISNPSTEIASTSDALQKDNWVQCEMCHKWRLLPYGLLPDCFPNMWICKMLDWLPGMNKCSFSEDDTRNALLAQYQIPNSVPEKHNIQPDCSKGGAPKYTSVGLQHAVGLSYSRTLEPPSLVENLHVQQLQHYTENEQQHSIELGNLKKLSQSTDDLNSIQRNAEVKPFKKEKKREAYHDACGVPKKVKKVHQQSNKEQSPAGVVSGGGRDGQNRSASSSEVSKEKLSGSLSTSIKKIKDKVHGTINTVQRQENDISGKKRKLMNELDSKSYRESSDWKEKILMDNQPVENRGPGTQMNKGSEHMGERNKKRSKGIELQEKELFTRFADANDKGAGCKDAAAEDMSLAQCRGSNSSHKSLEGRKSSKKDTESGLPSAIAATCNPSRLSGLCKVKVKYHEMKSSPAGSISSSPLKVLKVHDSNGNKVPAMHNEPEDLFSAKRLNFGPPDEKIRCVKSGIRTLVTNYDHDNNEDVFTKSVGEDKQVSSVKHHTEHRIEKQLKHDVGRDAHIKSESPITEDRFGVSPREPAISVNLSDRVQLKNLVPSGSGRGNRPRLSQCVSASDKGDGCVTTEIDNCDAKATKRPVDGDVPNNNGCGGDDGLTYGVRHNRRDGTACDDIEASSSLKKDSSQNPAQLLKEAKELKHTADRLKKTSSMRETAVVVFQAALKFLIGASLVEPVRTDGRTAGMISPSEVCRTTAEFCEYWAREFERCNDMALAALAYKCMEVACMRLVYCNDVAANRDQHELQVALRSVPQVDSPSSSASDVDNLNHQAAISSVKDLHFPVVHGNHFMPAGTMSSLVRLLNFTRDVHRGMEATRKSQRAFTDAHSKLSKSGNQEGISSLKRVLDFGFHDLGGLLRIVSLAMEALGG